jgi:hypothetical protein
MTTTVINKGTSTASPIKFKAGAVSDITHEMIHALVSILGPEQCPKTANELLSIYANREDQLCHNLKKMVITEIDKHVINLGLPKSSNELLTAYQGREDELLRMLRTMERKNEQLFSC